MGRNAIHRLGELLAIVEAYEARRPVVEGCEYREALQAVHVEGGVAGNVVPDSAMVRINHRFAPDRSSEEAVAHVRSVLAPALEDGDTVEVTDLSPAARPGLGDPLIEALVERNGLEVRGSAGPMLRSLRSEGARLEFRSWRRDHCAHSRRICRASVGGRHHAALLDDHQRRHDLGSELAHHGDDLAEDLHLGRIEHHVAERCVVGHEHDLAVALW